MGPDRDCWYGIPLHECNIGQEGLGFFHQNGEDVVVIFFSREQGKQTVDRFTSCFQLEERDGIREEVDDPAYLPEHSPQEPITIGGMAGRTLCAHFRSYQSLGFVEDRGYDNLGPRVIMYFYAPNLDAVWKGPKSTIIGLKDGAGRYHLYVVFSDDEARRVLRLHPDADVDLAHYEKLMRLSPMPPSDLPTIYLGGERGGVAARDLCLYIDVSRKAAA